MTSSPSLVSNPLEDYIMIPCGGRIILASRGYKFCPIDRDAIKHYLMNKAFGIQLPCDNIEEIDLYSYNPDQLPIREFKQGRDNEAYFFTYNVSTLSKRTTSKGYWQESSVDKPVLDEEQVIGYKKTFVFYWGNSSNGQKSNYVMQEYRLNPSLGTDDSSIKNNIENLVLCKVLRRKSRSTLLEDEDASWDEEETE